MDVGYFFTTYLAQSLSSRTTRSHDTEEEEEEEEAVELLPLRHSHSPSFHQLQLPLSSKQDNLHLAQERRRTLYAAVLEEKEGKMKFSHSLVFNSVPEWTSYYLK